MTDARPDATEELSAALRERILVIDGAMGTAIQRDRPSEAGYRGERFADWPSDLQGNNDLLSLPIPRGDWPAIPGPLSERRLAERPDDVLRRHWGAVLHVAARLG